MADRDEDFRTIPTDLGPYVVWLKHISSLFFNFLLNFDGGVCFEAASITSSMEHMIGGGKSEIDKIRSAEHLPENSLNNRKAEPKVLFTSSGKWAF